MKIGFIQPYSPENISFARENGFKSAELRVGPKDDFFPGKEGWEDKALKVKEEYESAGIEISCLAGFYVNHMDPEIEEECKDLVRKTVILAERMGVGTVAGFAGRVPGLEPMECLPKFKEIWGEHAKFAEDHGVRIAFENCPMGKFHLPPGGINMMCLPDVWEAAFDEVPSDALGLEWDPSHLICMFIDPVANLRKFGGKVYHVHAKDAHVHRDLLAKYGIYHEGVIEHCFPGLGDTDWGLVIKELRRHGYDGALDIEGWHDAVFRDHPEGPRWEREGLILAMRHLSLWIV